VYSYFPSTMAHGSNAGGDSFFAGLVDLTICKTTENSVSRILCDSLGCVPGNADTRHEPGSVSAGIELAPTEGKQPRGGDAKGPEPKLSALMLSDYERPIRVNDEKPGLQRRIWEDSGPRRDTSPQRYAAEEAHVQRRVKHESSHKSHQHRRQSTSPVRDSSGNMPLIRSLEELDRPSLLLGRDHERHRSGSPSARRNSCSK
jgi:hypothetical protein